MFLYHFWLFFSTISYGALFCVVQWLVRSAVRDIHSYLDFFVCVIWSSELVCRKPEVQGSYIEIN
jgi:hypothetical protein